MNKSPSFSPLWGRGLMRWLQPQPHPYESSLPMVTVLTNPLVPHHSAGFITTLRLLSPRPPGLVVLLLASFHTLASIYHLPRFSPHLSEGCFSAHFVGSSQTSSALGPGPFIDDLSHSHRCSCFCLLMMDSSKVPVLASESYFQLSP